MYDMLKEKLKKLMNNAWFIVVTWNVLFFGGLGVGSSVDGKQGLGVIALIWFVLMALWMWGKKEDIFTP